MGGRELLQRGLSDLRAPLGWIAWVRLVAVPFVFFEVGIERGNYPPGYERWAWTLATLLAVGAAILFVWRAARGATGFAAWVFDVAVVSAFAVVYSFEPSSPVRELLVLPVVEAALRWGRLGGALAPLASVPALALFEWKASDKLGVPYDPGHVVTPAGVQLLVGLIVGVLRGRRPS